VAGCLAALVVSPLAGMLVAAAFGVRAGAWASGALFVVLGAYSWLQFARADRTAAGPMTWSFTPLGAALVAATDVLATGGDAFGPWSYLALSVPCALLGGGVVFLTEILESHRPLYSLVKAAGATLLILVPLPVGGLIGAGASLGHRALGRRRGRAG
jgi:hypothetical protein